MLFDNLDKIKNKNSYKLQLFSSDCNSFRQIQQLFWSLVVIGEGFDAFEAGIESSCDEWGERGVKIVVVITRCYYFKNIIIIIRDFSFSRVAKRINYNISNLNSNKIYHFIHLTDENLPMSTSDGTSHSLLP